MKIYKDLVIGTVVERTTYCTYRPYFQEQIRGVKYQSILKILRNW